MISHQEKANQFMVRFPDGVREVIKERAKEAHRSMNAEIVYQLSRAYGLAEKEKAGEPLTA